MPLWDFVQARDLQAIGYPISQRWVDGPFTLQAFQKVILQWDPGKSHMNYYNTLDVLANRYPEVELPNVPPHQVLEADRGADFATITRNHLALLDQNAAIKERFLSEPNWLNLYGLPIRYEEREVNGDPQGLQMLRAQRTVFVIWNVPAPGVTVGRVNLQNVPDKVKRAEQRDHSGLGQGAGAGQSVGVIAGVFAGDAPGAPTNTANPNFGRLDRGRRRRTPHLRHPHRRHRGLLGQQYQREGDLHRTSRPSGWDIHRDQRRLTAYLRRAPRRDHHLLGRELERSTESSHRHVSIPDRRQLALVRHTRRRQRGLLG